MPKIEYIDYGHEFTDESAARTLKELAKKLGPEELKKRQERRKANHARKAQATEHGWHLDDRRTLSPKIAVTPDQHFALKTGHTVNVLGKDLVSADGPFRVITDEEMLKLQEHHNSSAIRKVLAKLKSTLGRLTKLQ